MKQKQFSSLICILFFFGLYSCSKKNDNGPVPVIQRYSSKLLKVYEIDTTKQAFNDTISKWFFAYDNANRLIGDSFVTNTTQGGISTTIRKIQYNGMDTFAYRSVTSSFASSDTIYYTFSNGNYVKDTAIY